MNIIECARGLKRMTRYWIKAQESWVKLLPKTERIDSGNCFSNPNGLLPKTEQICTERRNVRLSGIPKGIPKKAKSGLNERSSRNRRVGHQKKPFAVATEENIEELQKRHPRLNVRTLLPEAQKACAEKYQNDDQMGLPFFEEYLDRCELDMGPPGLIEGQRIKAEIVAEAIRDREEKEELTAEQKREPFIATLHTRFPQINVRGIAERYLAELDGKPWDNQRFKRLVGEAQAAFEKSLRGCQHA
jgi:hypothetical protein